MVIRGFDLSRKHVVEIESWELSVTQCGSAYIVAGRKAWGLGVGGAAADWANSDKFLGVFQIRFQYSQKL